MPDFFVLAGPNGAGKTTFTTLLAEQAKQDGYDLKIINGDLIYSELLRKNRQTENPAFRLQAQAFTTEQIQLAQREKKNILLESNMHHSYSYDIFTEAGKAGYQTSLYYVGIEKPQICINRVKQRVAAKIGHDVPPKDVVNRFKDSLYHFKTNFQKADITVFIDNSGGKMQQAIYAEKDIIKEIAKNCPDWVKEVFKNKLLIQEKLKIPIDNKDEIQKKIGGIKR